MTANNKQAERRLLILDDEKDIGQMIEAIARDSGVVTRFTTDAEHFFVGVGDWTPTDVIIDLMMPDMDGVQVLRRLAKVEPDCRVIIISGAGNRILQAAGRSAGEHGLNIHGILPKPFSPSQLRELLDVSTSLTRHTNKKTSRDLVLLRGGDIEKGLAEKQFSLVYQPKVDCRGGKLNGFEVLLRWYHPERGTIPPDRFIAVAERYGLIGSLTDFVLKEAFAWFSALMQRCRRNDQAEEGPLFLSVNISSLSLEDPGFEQMLVDYCASVGLPPSALMLELTETNTMKDPTGSLDLLTRLRIKGFQLSIDDFGTGYSSMLQLVRLPFSEMKIDKSFVLSALHSEESRTVIKSIIDLGHNLGMTITAEGVENQATWDYLQEADCDLLQGFYIAEPMSGEAVLAWLTQLDLKVE